MQAFKPYPFIFFICSITSSFAQVNLTDGLIACYSFSGNANDGSGNQNNGTVIGPTLASDRFGTPNRAYFFDGSDRISIPSAPIVGNQELSISTWASVSQNPGFGSAQMVFTIGDTDNSFFYGQTLTHHYSSSDFTGWGIGGFNKNNVAVSYCTFNLPNVQTWYHLVLTINLNTVTLYINGVQSGQSSTGGVPLYFYQRPSSVAYIGMRSNGIQGFEGTIDDISIYKRVITAAEITELYNNGLACSLPAVITPPVVNDVSICENDRATIIASGGTLYRWYDAPVNGNLIFTGNPFITTALTSTTSFYVANVVGVSESIRKKITVTVNPSPVLTLDFPKEGTVFEPVVFTASVTSGTMPFSYNFDFGDETVTHTTASTQIHTYHHDGQFQVKLIVSDANGCKDEVSDEIIIEGELFIPNVITANDDALNDTFTIYTIRDNQYFVYNGKTPFAMVVYNRWGEEVFHSEEPSEGWTGNDNSPGSYFYLISLGEKKFKGWLNLLK